MVKKKKIPLEKGAKKRTAKFRPFLLNINIMAETTSTCGMPLGGTPPRRTKPFYLLVFLSFH
jgi:hypothetical protein